jgi:light-regulated signal transduction histidine kinase (bacteriophytochrome)
VVGHLLSDFIIPHEFREMHNKGLQHYLKTGQGTVLNKFLEVEALNRQGKKFPVEMTILPIDQQNEKFFCAFIRDISERKRSEILMKQLNERLEKRAEELQSSNTELEHFAYVASHDLQEPLRMVTSFMALLKKKLNNHLDESAASYMHFAVDGAERMKTLIQDLLKYSRLGNTAEGSTSFEIKEVITNVLQVYSPAIRENEAIVHLGEFPLISGNKTQINQLFQNLVGNALKYRNTKPPVLEIGCTEKKEEWLFFIKDNGIGIDPKFFDKIFVIFQRLHNKNEFSGTGIGLAICKIIVERHGGKLWVESSLGHGSTFYFTLKKPQHV